jgi:hypothetical protein
MKRRLMLIVPVVVVLVALGAALAMRPTAPAHASQGFRGGGGWMFQPPFSEDLPTLLCGFPVHIDTLADNIYVRETTQPDGTVVDTSSGNITFRLTNKDTGTFIDLDLSGPGTAYFYPDGSVYQVYNGRTVNIFFPQDQQTSGLPGIASTTGFFSFTFASDGSLEGYTLNGTVTDDCAALS